MVEFRRILCPVDFSEYSRHAFDHALAIAHWQDGIVTVLHVSAPVPVVAYAPAYAGGGGEEPADERRARRALERFAAVESGAAVPVRFETIEGNTATEIVALAHAMPADLVVMGTHGRSGFARVALGSVTEAVIRRVACPVLSIPPTLADVVPAPPVAYRRILCAVDFSACSMHALMYATAMAQEAAGQLTVVHVTGPRQDPHPAVLDVVLGAPGANHGQLAPTQADARARLEAAIPDAVRDWCSIETVAGVGKPHREILHMAEERRSDLIVLGVHGRGAADLLLFGSTAQYVVRQAPCPVLTVRQR